MSASPTTNSNSSSSGANNGSSGGPLMSPSLSAASSTANNSSATMATGATSLSTFGNQTGSGGAPTAPVASSNVSEQKLKRFLEHNQRLKEQLDMRRISVSEAGQSLIQYVSNTRDALLPIVWGTVGSDPFSKQTTSCCTIS